MTQEPEPDFPDPRADRARKWAIQALKLDKADFVPASADASFRRYFRVTDSASEQSWIVMDAPPELEDCAPFIRISDWLDRLGLHVPRVLARHREEGFLLLTDLGRQTYLECLNQDNAAGLMDDAIRCLVKMQATPPPPNLPPYDARLLVRELGLFPEWYAERHLRAVLSKAQSRLWASTCQTLVDSALDQPMVFVHRDFMPRNLMRSDPNPGVIDFQDAVIGPVTYDPVCLFKDAFLSWPDARVDAWLDEYRTRALHAGIRLPKDFRKSLDLMGLHRHLKVLGIFARIRYRDGKPHYLEDAPRFIRYVRDVACQYPETADLIRLFDSLELAA